VNLRPAIPTVVVLLLAAARVATAGEPPAAPTFERDVLPILSAKCVACHGDRAARKADLDVRSAPALFHGGENGPAVVPGELDESLLWQMIESEAMPPEEDPETKAALTRLSADEMSVIRRWIEAGAPAAAVDASSPLHVSEEDRRHWAFRSPERPAVPAVERAELVRNPIDAFVVARLEAAGLSLSPEIEPVALLRRVTVDLTGLPPTLEEIAAFEADSAADRYERVVERLLASPRYGERWARHWLDLAGYADSEGYLAEDRVRPLNYRYRDYVIRSLNEDKPYDRFLREQLAGDELVDHRDAETMTPEIADHLIATAFLRQASDPTRDDFRYPDMVDYNWRTLEDTLEIVGTSLLGLTIGCAKCHGHKYEPISQAEYYQLQGLLMGGFRPGNWPPQHRRRLPLLGARELAEVNAHNTPIDAAVRELEAQLKTLVDAVAKERYDRMLAALPAEIRADVAEALDVATAKRTDVQKYLAEKFGPSLRPEPDALKKLLVAENPALKEAVASLEKRIAGEKSRRRAIPEARAFYDLPGDTETRLLKRGDFKTPGQAVEPGVPVVLDGGAAFEPFRWSPPAADAATSGRRLAFARWLTQPRHPLTARLIVNRLWHHHFGRGIVDPPANLGRSGGQPTHPELLDWLATEFVERGWSLKAMHRLMVTSSVYRQTSIIDPVAHARAMAADPANSLWWRCLPRRMEGEVVRDSLLTVSGALNPEMFGPPVGVKVRADGEVVVEDSPAGRRRSIYLLVRRSEPVTLMQLFDVPVMERNCTVRAQATVSTQALTMTNSDFVVAQATVLAERVLKDRPVEADGDPAPALDHACRMAYARHARPSEVERMRRFLDEQTVAHAAAAGSPQDPATRQAAYRRAWADLAQMLFCANEFICID